MPKSKWTKKAMLDALRKYCYENDLYYRDTTDSMTKAEIFEHYFEYKDSYVTRSYIIWTDFYGVVDEVAREEFAPKTYEEKKIVDIQRADREEARARKEAEHWARLARSLRSDLERYREKMSKSMAAIIREEGREAAAMVYRMRYGFSPRSYSAYALTFPERVTYRESRSGNMWMECHEGNRLREVLERDAMVTDCPFFRGRNNALDYLDETPIEPTSLPTGDAA